MLRESHEPGGVSFGTSPIDPWQLRMSITHPTLHVGATTNDHPVSWIANIQGDLVTVQCLRYRQVAKPESKRGIIVGFTRASRFRLLKFIATVNWAEALPCLFITLTYPDAVVTTRTTLRNKHRYLFHRSIEKALGVNVPMIWRVEWVARKSGVNKGIILPHIHLLLFGVPFLDVELIRHRWSTTIGHSDWCSVWVEACKTSKHAALYVAKYCGKVEAAIPSLDKQPYLNIGRQYGYTRKSLIPLCPNVRIALTSQQVVDDCRIEANHALRDYDLDRDESFTILGQAAMPIKRILGKVPT